MAISALSQVPDRHNEQSTTFQNLILDAVRVLQAEVDRKERIFKDAEASASLLYVQAAHGEASLAAQRANKVKSEFQDLQEKLSSGTILPSIVLHKAVGICVREHLFHLLTAHGIPHPAYNYLAPYKSSDLPWDIAPSETRVSAPSWKVLGFDVGFPIGIPASVLTANAAWIAYYAGCGFNVLTFKTVRTEQRDPHAFPNWLFVQGCTDPIPPDHSNQHRVVRASADVWPDQSNCFSMVNSFGVPSVQPEAWQEELNKAYRQLGPGKLLIVSVIGNESLLTLEAIAADYARAAVMAKEAGAVAIELNLSCPNTIKDGQVKEELLCHDPEYAATVAAAVRKEVGSSVKLVTKLSYMRREQLEMVVRRCVQEADIDGVSGINTWQVEVRAVGSGQPAFPGRHMAGLSGIGIRELGLDFARSVVSIREGLGKRDLEIIAMGGVMTADDVEQYLSLGVAAVQTATAAFFNATLAEDAANRYRTRYLDEQQQNATSRALDILTKGPQTFSGLLVELSGVLAPTEIEIASRARSVLSELESQQLVRSYYRSDGRLVFEISGDQSFDVRKAGTR